METTAKEGMGTINKIVPKGTEEMTYERIEKIYTGQMIHVLPESEEHERDIMVINTNIRGISMCYKIKK